MTVSIRKKMIQLKKSDVEGLIPLMKDNRSILMSSKDFPAIRNDWKYYFANLPYCSTMKGNSVLEGDILLALKTAVLANKNSEAVKLINSISQQHFNQDFLDHLAFIKGLLLIKKGAISDEAKFNLSTHLKYLPQESLSNLVHYFMQYIIHSKSKNETFKRAKRLIALYSKSNGTTQNGVHRFLNALEEILFGDSTRVSDPLLMKLIRSQDSSFSINPLERNVLVGFAYLANGKGQMTNDELLFRRSSETFKRRRVCTRNTFFRFLYKRLLFNIMSNTKRLSSLEEGLFY